MKDLNPLKGKYYIEELVAQGEHQQQDFKFLISDARKIARSISAFANRDGGRLLIGVKDNGTIAGVRNEEDIYVVEQAAARYCRPPQQIEFTAFNAGTGTLVIRASIAKAGRRPQMESLLPHCRREHRGSSSDGQSMAATRVARCKRHTVLSQ